MTSRPWKRRTEFGEASGSAAAWLAPPAGHPLGYMSSRDMKTCRTQPRPARPAQAPQQCHALRFGGWRG